MRSRHCCRQRNGPSSRWSSHLNHAHSCHSLLKGCWLVKRLCVCVCEIHDHVISSCLAEKQVLYTCSLLTLCWGCPGPAVQLEELTCALFTRWGDAAFCRLQLTSTQSSAADVCTTASSWWWCSNRELFYSSHTIHAGTKSARCLENRSFVQFLIIHLFSVIFMHAESSLTD